jgi:hypothetical protein
MTSIIWETRISEFKVPARLETHHGDSCQQALVANYMNDWGYLG